MFNEFNARLRSEMEKLAKEGVEKIKAIHERVMQD